ncbi:MAG: hypothetical protein ACUVR1_10440 [Fimbriimonadales bacterium]
MSLATLLEWWNFIFALPLAAGALLLMGLAFSGMIDLGGDSSEGDAADADAAAENAIEAQGEVGEGDAEQAESGDDHHSLVKTPYTPHDHHAPAEKPLWLKFLNLFGIGMGLPLTMALPLLLMMWGAVGLIANRVLAPLLPAPALFAPLSMGIALFTMALTGRTAGRIIRRVLRDEAPQVVDRYGLVGSTGRAVYEITAEGGVAHVRDRYGNLHRIVCRAVPGEPTIPADTPILVARYDEQTHLYWVERNPLELPNDMPEGHASAQQQIGGHTFNGG